MMCRITIILSVAVVFVNSFSYPTYTERRRPITLNMAATGMGMAATKGNKKKKKKKGGSKSKVIGQARSSSSGGTKYDVAKSMIKNEKRYDELMAESAKSLQNDDEWVNDNDIEITTEYIIAARSTPGLITSNAMAAASDWIPVAQICIVRPIHLHHEEEDKIDASINPSVRAAVSYYCREISYAAALAAPTLKSLPRSSMQYSAEPLDSFVKYVYENVVEGKSVDTFVDPNDSDSKEISMTKSMAREILQLEEGCKDAPLIKKAYKQQSMLHHPDRFVNSDKTKEEIEASARQFGLVKMAYEALLSGVRDEKNSNGMIQSWYESLGGKSRSEFTGAIDLISNEKAGHLCNKAFKAAIVTIDPDLTNTFVVRNQQTARLVGSN